MKDEPLTYMLRAPGCVTGPCESLFSVAVEKVLEMPIGTEIVPLYARSSEADQRDAARWRFAVEHGMPVRNQTAHTASVRWLALGPQGMRAGPGPVEAIDAAMRQSDTDSR